MGKTATMSKKTVREIPADPKKSPENRWGERPIRMAAYCRVSTEKEEQEKSFETQVEMYTEKIMLNPHWQMAGIYADEGLTGTIAKKRPQFMQMIEDCRKGKIDAIITKSVSRFSRNNLDCLMYIRELKERGIPVIFEKEGINTLQVSSELFITLFSGLSQAESESISENVKMGKRHNIQKGNVAISFGNMLGYCRGQDGRPEIVPSEAETVRIIFDRFLAGMSLLDIAKELTESGCKTGKGNAVWSAGGIKRILTNEKYKGDALLQKTFTTDPISKKKKKNTGELPMYYIENNHPAIIERAVFDRAQEELARRNSKRKVKQVGTTTEQGKYSGRYALTDLLFCGECGTPYRRCTWTRKDGKKIVWRCISRLDYGNKYCKHSPSIEEYRLHAAIADAITAYARQGGADIEHLKAHIRLYELQSQEQSYMIQKRINELDAAFADLLKLSGRDREDEQYDDAIQKILEEKAALCEQLQEQQAGGESQQSLLNHMEHADILLEGLKNRPVEYDDRVIRQLVECVKVLSADKLLVCFYGGDHIEATI